ncbi:MAG: YbaN family protein [Actinomycetota bacterium]
MPDPSPPTTTLAPARSRIARGAWSLAGLVAVALGAIGIVVPGLPTTIFFIIAAWAFSKSSPRLEAWVLGLPKIGPLVQDHRDGLGMPRRAKGLAIAMIVLFAGVSAWLVDGWVIPLTIVATGAVGIAYIAFRVPTRERVLAERDG